MKEVIIKNNNYRVVKQTVSYPDLEREHPVTYCRYKLQERMFFFWRTIVTHPYLSDNETNNSRGLAIYTNLFRCIVSAKIF